MLLNNHNYCKYCNNFLIKIYDFFFTKRPTNVPMNIPMNETTYKTITDETDSSSQCSSDEDYFVVNYQNYSSSSEDNY